MTKKRMCIILLFIVSVFIAINIVWFISIGCNYLQYEKGMNTFNSEGSLVKYYYEDDEYEYFVKPPRYLSFSSGFLRVSKKEYLERFVSIENDNRTVFYYDKNGVKTIVDDYHQIEFYYWKKPFGTSEYGIMYWGKIWILRLYLTKICVF